LDAGWGWLRLRVRGLRRLSQDDRADSQKADQHQHPTGTGPTAILDFDRVKGVGHDGLLLGAQRYWSAVMRRPWS
jgi:hypothetical protein